MSQTYADRKKYLERVKFFISEMIKANERARKVEQQMLSYGTSAETVATVAQEILDDGTDLDGRLDTHLALVDWTYQAD